jgi:hypothetical protein
MGHHVNPRDVDPVIPLHVALRALEETLAYQIRRADSLERIARRALDLHIEPCIIEAKKIDQRPR